MRVWLGPFLALGLCGCGTPAATPPRSDRGTAMEPARSAPDNDDQRLPFPVHTRNPDGRPRTAEQVAADLEANYRLAMGALQRHDFATARHRFGFISRVFGTMAHTYPEPLRRNVTLATLEYGLLCAEYRSHDPDTIGYAAYQLCMARKRAPEIYETALSGRTLTTAQDAATKKAEEMQGACLATEKMRRETEESIFL